MRLPATLLLVSSVVTACGIGEPQQSAPTGGAPPAVPVEILTLQPKPVEQVGEFVGTIKSRRSTTVQPQAEGFVTKILVASGDRVRPGTPLFEIDAATQQAVVASLEGQRASREADAVYARQQADRVKALFDGGIISREAYEQAVTRQKNADAQLESVTDQIRQQQAELAYYQVVAQAAGIVGDVPVRVGDRVTRATALTTIEDNAALEVYISVPVQQAPRLELGLPVRLVDDGGETLSTTRISFVARSVDDATQTVLLKAPVDARGGALRADQFVRTEIVWSTEPGLTVPVLAAQRISNQYFVFVAEDGDGGLVARQRPVTLGPVVGDAYVVLGGLSAGDRLILAGTQKIGDGARVQALSSGSAGAPAVDAGAQVGREGP